MKVVVEKVPEGVKVTFAADAKSKPVVVVVRPEQLGLIETVMRTAMRSESFRFEYQN